MPCNQLKTSQPKMLQGVDFFPNLKIFMENLGKKIKEQIAHEYFLWELMVGGNYVSNITTAVRPFSVCSVITKDFKQKRFWHVILDNFVGCVLAACIPINLPYCWSEDWCSAVLITAVLFQCNVHFPNTCFVSLLRGFCLNFISSSVVEPSLLCDLQVSCVGVFHFQSYN